MQSKGHRPLYWEVRTLLMAIAVGLSVYLLSYVVTVSLSLCT